MKTCYLTLLAAIALMIGGEQLFAQPGGGQRGQGPRAGRGPGQGGGQGQGQGQGQRRGGPGGFQGRGGPGGQQGGVSPLMALLDRNRDGMLSKEEIENASTVIARLDTDGDGNVSAREVFAAARERGPQGGQRGAGPGGPGQGGQRGRGGQGAEDVIGRIKALDENNDGVISADEIPERMAQYLNRADTNGNGSLEAAEIEAIAGRMGQRGGGQRGGGRGAGTGTRPERPQRPGDDK